MKYVFRALKKNVTTKTKKINGVVHYELPIVVRDKDKNETTYHVYVNKAKTYQYGDSLYIVLDNENPYVANYLKENLETTFTDKELLKIYTNDYISYMVSKDYTDKASHAINNLMPVGIQETNPETKATRTLKWNDTCKKLEDIYGTELTCVEPFATDFLYPFHYSRFKEGKFPREYLANMMMFLLTIDNNFEFTTEKKFDNQAYIYYKLKDRYFPFFRMITDEQFYESCLVKDVKNCKKTPFLKRFNDHGLTRELIQFIKEDETYKETAKAKYKAIRDEMKLDNEKERIFIPALPRDALFVLQKMRAGDKLTKKEKDLYRDACKERVINLAKEYYEKDLKFFFSYDDIANDELFINACSKSFIDMPILGLEYDDYNRVLYANINSDNRIIPEKKPIFEVVTRKELEDLKDDVYKYWISTKHFKR